MPKPPPPPRKTDEELKLQWADSLKPLLGRTIVGIRYMTPEEMDAAGWDRSPVMLILDDGTLFYPSSDDEGNDAGALYIAPSYRMKQAGVPDGAPVI